MNLVTLSCGVMASDELIHLIDLSLGVQPQGVVNFNYLHGLLHEIVRRLLIIEDLPTEQFTAQPEKVRRTKRAKKGGSKLGVSKSDTQGFGESSSLGKSGGLSVSDGLGGSGGLDGSGDDDDDGGGHISGGDSPVLGKSMSLKQVGSYTRSRPGMVTAANDIGVLERKLQDLEQRVKTMESLPDMLAKMATDSKATPVSDMWNFTNLDKRLTATEEGLGKVIFILVIENFWE